MMITEAGIVGKIGLNEAGVGICMSAIIADALAPGTPLHIVMRGVLDSPSLNSALDKVIKSKTASAINFIITQHGVTAVNMEIIPQDFDLTFPVDGFIAHTNHFLCERLLSQVKDFGREMCVDSFLRLDRARHLLAAAPKVDLPMLKQFQSDHYNYPMSICRHLDQSDPQLIASIFSVVLDLTNKEMHLSPGQPCESDYTTLKLT